jgi:hypothetical protein
MQSQIDETISDTQSRLIENFDVDVVNKLRIRKQTDELRLTQFQELLWLLSIEILKDEIQHVNNNEYKFTLKQSPATASQHFATGPYQMGKTVEDAYTYRIGHPLAEFVLTKAKTTDTSQNEHVLFDYSSSPNKVSILEKQVGKCGVLTVSMLRFQCAHEVEEHVVGVALDEEGNVLPDDFVNKLMMLHATTGTEDVALTDYQPILKQHMTTSIKHITANVNTRNKQFIDDESQKISRWAEDQTYALEQELQDFKRRIKEKERAFKNETDNAARLDIQKEILSLQRQVNQKRQSLFALEDEIDQRRNELILQIEASLNQTIHEEELFTIYWKIK